MANVCVCLFVCVCVCVCVCVMKKGFSIRLSQSTERRMSVLPIQRHKAGDPAQSVFPVFGKLECEDVRVFWKQERLIEMD